MNAVVFGASGGIGRALVAELSASGVYETVFAVSRSDARVDGASSLKADITNDADLAAVAERLRRAGPVRLCIVAAGLLSDGDTLQPEKSYRQQSLDSFRRVFDVNTFGPALAAKHILPLMPREGRAVFAALSARVGSISDNRIGGWHAYRASKAALNMLVKNFAIEQARRNDDFIAIGLHPGTVDTPLSKPFQSGVPDAQLFSAEHSAECLLKVIDGLTANDTGKVFDWAGEEILP